jgi:hypothetical protein
LQELIKGNETAVKFPRRRALVYASAAVAALIAGGIAAKVALAPAPAGPASRVGKVARAPARVWPPSPPPGAIVIDPSVGDTFAPAPADAAPALTAAQAWTQYAQVNGDSATIPSDLTVQLGLVSVPVGPAEPDEPDEASLATSNGIAYSALNELAYGYSWPRGSCPMSRNPKVPGPIGKSCTDWTFVDANTGQLIEATSQVLS